MLTRKKRVLIILQLIFAFSLLVWVWIKPYTMKVVAKKSQTALYEMVMEREALFNALPLDDQLILKEGHKQGKTPTLYISTSPFVIAWIFFAILVSILLLFQIEGAIASSWLLPALVLAYGYFLYTAPPKKGGSLFPTEEYVREHYLTEEGRGRDHLIKAWHRYLIVEWANESPSANDSLFKEQLDKGLFAFNVERLKWIHEGKGDDVVITGFTSPPSFLRLLTYFLWNLLFAWLITKKSPSERQLNPA